MTASVPADRFVRPAAAWYLALQPGLVLLSAMAASESVYDKVRGRVPLPSRRTVQALAAATAAVHVGEAAFAYRKARSLGMTRSAPRWAVETFACGFPVLLSLANQAPVTEQ
ncbi:MAG: DUF4499 domain-containing protein [Acidimicrobiales bacterium]|nr:DUF4499 domain-containing protein [Acidimicrobiales bacterium]MCB1259922.1 DUF4499 domain-containing protein [Acidimicrobiales bacterium]